jgi:hypothetical protein
LRSPEADELAIFSQDLDSIARMFGSRLWREIQSNGRVFDNQLPSSAIDIQ